MTDDGQEPARQEPMPMHPARQSDLSLLSLLSLLSALSALSALSVCPSPHTLNLPS